MGGGARPETRRSIAWKKSRSLFNLKARTEAETRSLSRRSLERLCSSSSNLSFSSCSFTYSSSVLSDQSLIDESPAPVIIRSVSRSVLPSSCSDEGRSSIKSMAQIFSSCISNVFWHYCFLKFHTLTIPSTLAVATCSPALSQAAFTKAEV